MNDTTLTAPDAQLAVHDLAVHLPFDLFYPRSGQNVSSPAEPGSFAFTPFTGEGWHWKISRFPASGTEHAADVGARQLPAFRRKVQLYGAQIDDLLFPARYRFGLKIDGVDLGRLTRALVGTEYPGPSMPTWV